MDGVLEQILAELKDIKKLIGTSQGSNFAAIKGKSTNDTMKTKEAAEYLGITEYRLRTLTKQAAIRHFEAGNRFLYKRKTLDLWLEETQEASVQQSEEEIGFGRIRKIKE